MKNLIAKICAGQIKALLFDLDGTLYSSKAGIEFEIKPQMRRSLAEILNLPIEDAHKLLWGIIKKHDSEAIGLREMGIDLDLYYTNVYKNLNLEKVVPYIGLHEVFKKIKTFNVETILLTNSSRIHAQRILKQLNLSSQFDHIVSFEDNNYRRKPDRWVYTNTLDRYSLEPDNTIYFDDSLPNLYAAYQLGFNTVIVSNGLAEPPHFMEMHFRVRHEIPEFVDAHSFDIVATLSEIAKYFPNAN